MEILSFAIFDNLPAFTALAHLVRLLVVPAGSWFVFGTDAFGIWILIKEGVKMAEIGALELSRRAQHALESSPIRVLRDVRVDRSGKALVLSGHVESFYLKQLAQELVRTVATNCELINSIDVQ